MLEVYFFVHNFLDSQKIILLILKFVPHVINWWENYYGKNYTEDSGMFQDEPTWDFFMDAAKEKYYHVENYDD
jgi:hypothetical protein